MLLTFLSCKAHEACSTARAGADRTEACGSLIPSTIRAFVQDAVDRGWFRETCSIVMGVPNVRLILETIRDIAAGMAHMHDRGIVHGDMTGELQGQ